jgi:hypothetical protein
MTTRYEIKAWRESQQGKAYTVRIGSAWVDQKGVTRLAFDALPIPDKDGRVACFLEVPRDREDVSQRDTAPARSSAPVKPGRAMDDDIPF